MIFVLNRTWFVLISCSSDCPQLAFTVRPWVKTGLSLHGLPSPVLAGPAKEKESTTIRLVDSPICLAFDSPHTSRPSPAPSSQCTLTPSAPPHISTRTLAPSSRLDSMQNIPECRTRSAVLFGSRDKNQIPNQSSPRTPSTGRARGKTVPLLGGSPRTPESGTTAGGRADSALSWTPSSSSKNLAGWFSGLLGR
jgi:hypothetical protein